MDFRADIFGSGVVAGFVGSACLFVLAAWAVMSAFRGSFWKVGKKGPKPRCPLPRKGPFRVKSNPLKVYRPPRPDFLERARQHREEQLEKAKKNPYECAFNGCLRDLGFLEGEGKDYVWQDLMMYPGGYAIPDFHFRKLRHIFEVDGKNHNDPDQFRHDVGRDAYCRSQGIKVTRITNQIALHRPDLCRSIVLAELGHQ